MLRNAATRRRIELLLCPDGMSRRKNNKSIYSKRKQSIFWTIELRFHGTDVAIFHHGVDECGSLLYVFGKHLAPGPWKHKLRPFSDARLDDLNLFLQKNPKDSKSLYRKLDIKAPVGSQLEDITIIEYPVIFVYLPSQDYEFEVETSRMPPPSACNDVPTPDITLYDEEVIEEGDEESDTRITYLMDNKKSEDSGLPTNTRRANEIVRTDNQVLFTEKQISEKSDGAFRYQIHGEDHSALTPNSFESVDPVFYFEQEVRDAYDDLIGEMNPDDFLCLDGANDDDSDLGETRWDEIAESRMVDAEKHSAFGISEGKGFGEGEGNECCKENLISDLEETEGNPLKRRRGDSEEKCEDFFLSDEVPFGEMELEEGEIPFFVC